MGAVLVVLIVAIRVFPSYVNYQVVIAAQGGKSAVPCSVRQPLLRGRQQLGLVLMSVIDSYLINRNQKYKNRVAASAHACAQGQVHGAKGHEAAF